MAFRRIGLVFVATSVILWLGLASAMTQPLPTLRATLSGYEETPTLSTLASGMFTARLSDGMLEYTLSYDGLTSGVLFAHIHLGEPAIKGGVVAFLCGGGGKPACPSPGGTATGTIVAADVISPAGQGLSAGDFEALVRAILHGAAYVNVHSQMFPAGEIRGQIRGANIPPER